jgi:hypothetical protein
MRLTTTLYFTDPNYQGFQDPSPLTWVAQNLKSFEDIRAIADLPEYLSIFDEYQNSEDIITSETVSDAYWTLLSGDGPEAALSEYYGTDVNLGDTTGADYSNISKYGDMGEEEFRAIPVHNKTYPRDVSALCDADTGTRVRRRC